MLILGLRTGVARGVVEYVTKGRNNVNHRKKTKIVVFSH